MNKTRVKELLEQWTTIINCGELISTKKAEKIAGGGLLGRIKRTKGQHVIFDLKTHDNQIEIQNSLCQELPMWSDVIRSQPALMDGWAWPRGDFIQLYFEHFRVVVEKLRRILDQLPTTDGGMK